MNYRTSLHAIVVGFLTFATVTVLYGQVTGTISGTVTDVSGSAVPGAKVTLTAPATGVTRTINTDERGGYVIPSLGVANYDVKVELQGFQTATAQAIFYCKWTNTVSWISSFPPQPCKPAWKSAQPPWPIQTSDATLGQVITSSRSPTCP
jgi:hypothetical protein